MINGTDFPSRIIGSTFADTAAQTVTAPEGQAIIGIQFLANTTIDELVPKNGLIWGSFSTSHLLGSLYRTVNQSNATTNKIIFDQENYVKKTDQIEVGDLVYDGATGVKHGTVSALDPDGDNTKEIQISASVAITNNEIIAFRKGGKRIPGTNIRDMYINGQGIGGQAMNSSQIFPIGITIYGYWDSVSLAADDTDGGIIVYFGSYIHAI
tara:strand:+ start:57 stop:686 length:630 start_codon:yes stop_codon:yes gene_type:complete